jgi:hypothetical protein
MLSCNEYVAINWDEEKYVLLFTMKLKLSLLLIEIVFDKLESGIFKILAMLYLNKNLFNDHQQVIQLNKNTLYSQDEMAHEFNLILFSTYCSDVYIFIYESLFLPYLHVIC